MKCTTFMEHLDDFLDIQLNDLEMEAMQAHAESCPECAAEMEKQRRLIEELGRLDDDVKAPEGLLKKTMARIHAERHPKKKLGWWIGGGIAAALCVTVGVSALFSGVGADTARSEAAYDYSVYSDTEGNTIYMQNSSADQKVIYDAPAADAPAEDAVVMMDAPMAEEPMAAPMPMVDESGATVYADDAMPMPGEQTEADNGQYGLKIIREASIDLQTENYEQDVEKLKALVAEFGGYITSTEEQGSPAHTERYGGTNRWCNLTIRVPSERLDEFIERFESIGIVSFTSISETDVTAQYVDTDRRLASYRKQYDRVLAMMEQAQTVEELISIESELSRLEMLIEESQGSLNYWDSRVNMSTVRVFVNEVRRATPITENPTLGERMAESLSENWYYFVEGCKDTLVNVYGSLPYIALWVVILGAMGGVTVLIVRRVRKKKK